MFKVRKCIVFCLLCLVLCFKAVGASANDMTCSTAVDGRNVTVSGNLPNVTQAQEVTIFVGTQENIIYVDQITSETNGDFCFQFKVPESLAYGTYDLNVGTDADANTYRGTPNYSAPVVNEKMVITTAVDGRNVTVNGNLPNVTQAQEVTIFVGTQENIIYVDQITSETNGDFYFQFKVPENLPSGKYALNIGTDADVDTYKGTLNYSAPVVNVREIINADVTVSISNYVPSISGTLYCSQNKAIMLEILNKTDNTVVASEILTSEDGVFNLSYTLPSLLNPKEYEAVLSCVGTRELANISVTIDSSVLTLEINGAVSTAQNVVVDAQLQSVNTGLIDKSTSFTGSRNVSVTIPNLVSNASFHLTATGYETVTETQTDDNQTSCTAQKTNNQEFTVVLNAANVSSFDDKVFVLKYDKNVLTPTSLFGTQYENVLGTGTRGNVNITSFSAGEIKFKMVNVPIPENKLWSGVMNVFKFKFASQNGGTSKLVMYEEE